MEVDYSQQPGLEPIGPTSPHSKHYTANTPVADSNAGHSYAPGWNAVGAEPEKPKKRRICGLAPLTFGLIVALVILVIAAAVGGGVGGSIAVKNAKDSARKEALAAAAASSNSSSSTCTTSNSSSTTTANTYKTTQLAWGSVMTDPLPSSGCPAINNTIYKSTNGPQSWRVYCKFDMPGYDLLQTNTPNIQLCIETCANWNTLYKATTPCKGVAFVPSYILGQGFASEPSDCYLKSNATVALLSDKSADTVEFVSVIVQ